VYDFVPDLTRGARLFLLGSLLFMLAPLAALAGGPKFVAGVSYFNPGVLGQSAHWSGGLVNYYVDQVRLSSTVNLYQALYEWAPPCAVHGVCAPSQLLATQASTGISALDGSVTFNPASLPGAATRLLGVAATGSASSLNIAIDMQP